MDYYDPMNELDDKNNPYLLGYVDATIQIFNHVYAELAGANARCETLSKMVTQYQDELIPGYRERAEKAERERDAAVSDLEAIMAYGGSNIDTCEYCKNVQCYGRGGAKPCLPQWRGPKEEQKT